MGAHLAAKARLACHSLTSDRARLVLFSMALTAHDKDREPSYFAGSEFLAMGLGFADPASEAAQKAVGRAVKELREAGLIVQDAERPRSWKRRYYLHLPGP